MADTMYPQWQEAIRKAQTIRRETEAQEEAEKAAKTAELEKIKGQHLKAALSMLGIEVETPDTNVVILEPVKFWIEAPIADDDGKLIKFKLHMRYALPYAWSEISEYQFYHNWRNYEVEFRYSADDHWYCDIDRIKAGIANQIDSIVSAIEKDAEAYTEYLDKQKVKEAQAAQPSLADVLLEMLREIVREEMQT